MARKRRLEPDPGSHSSKMKSPARGVDVMVARDRLKGALHDLLHSDEESSSSQEEIPTTPSKMLQLKKEAKATIIRRRKRKMPLELEVGFHHTFVMKLFDRSVDLAQFQEDTPLYPICRAWIANQPRVPTPIQAPESPQIKEEMEGLTEFEDVLDVHKLPPPSSPAWTSRIPAAEIPQISSNTLTLDYTSENLPTANELLSDHLERWGRIRQQWVEAAKNNEQRFQKSGNILYNIFRRSQNGLNMQV